MSTLGPNKFSPINTKFQVHWKVCHKKFQVHWKVCHNAGCFNIVHVNDRKISTT